MYKADIREIGESFELNNIPYTFNEINDVVTFNNDQYSIRVKSNQTYQLIDHVHMRTESIPRFQLGLLIKDIKGGTL